MGLTSVVVRHAAQAPGSFTNCAESGQLTAPMNPELTRTSVTIHSRRSHINVRLQPIQANLSTRIRNSIPCVYFTNEVCTATTIDEVRGGQSPQPHSS